MTCNSIAVIGLVAASTLSVLIIGLAGGLATSTTQSPASTPIFKVPTTASTIPRTTTTSTATNLTTTTLTTTAAPTTTSTTTTTTTTTSTTTTSTVAATLSTSTVATESCGCYDKNEEISIENGKCVLDLGSFRDVAGNWTFTFDFKINNLPAEPTDPRWDFYIISGIGRIIKNSCISKFLSRILKSEEYN